MSTPQSRPNLPQEIRDKIFGFMLVDEVIRVRTVKKRVYLTKEQIRASLSTSGSLLDALLNQDSYLLSSHNELEDVDLVYSDALRDLMGAGGIGDELQHLVYKNSIIDLTDIVLYGVRDRLKILKILKPLLRVFRNLQVVLNSDVCKLGFFNQIEHLTMVEQSWFPQFSHTRVDAKFGGVQSYFEESSSYERFVQSL